MRGIRRIYRLLQSKLNESGWVDRLHDQAKGLYAFTPFLLSSITHSNVSVELARSKYPIIVQDIIEDVRNTVVGEYCMYCSLCTDR